MTYLIYKNRKLVRKITVQANFKPSKEWLESLGGDDFIKIN